MPLPPNRTINASDLQPGDILYPFRAKVLSVSVIASYRDPEAPAQVIARLEGDVQVPGFSPRNRLHVHRSRARRFNLYTTSTPIPSASGNGEWYIQHDLILRDWRPARLDLSREEIRRLARVSPGGGCYLGGGAAPEFFARRIA